MSSLWQWIQRHLRGKKSRAKEERFSLCRKKGIQKVLQHTSLNLTLGQIKEKLGFFLSGSDPYRGGRSAGGVDYKSEKVYMTKDYLDMMWGRNKFQQTILELGYNFLFTDVDILWFRNPMRHIAVASDIAISSDFFVGDPDSLVNFPNGGFLYGRSCEKTVEFYKNWQLCRDKYPGKHEQNVFNQIKGELSVRLKVKILQFLDTAFCSGFCQLAKDLNSVCTMHANCCVGLASKMHDLRSVLEC